MLEDAERCPRSPKVGVDIAPLLPLPVVVRALSVENRQGCGSAVLERCRRRRRAVLSFLLAHRMHIVTVKHSMANFAELDVNTCYIAGAP